MTYSEVELAFDAGQVRSPLGRTVWSLELSLDETLALVPGVPFDLPRRPDVLVIGGGIQGLAAAKACEESGMVVVLIEAGSRLALGSSGRAAGSLCPELHFETDGAEFVDLARQSLRIYSEWLVGSSCLRRLPWLVLDPSAYLSGNLPPGACLLSRSETQACEPHVAARRAVWIPRQGHVNPLRAASWLASQLAHTATGLGALSLRLHRGRLAAVRTTQGDFWPKHVIVASGGYGMPVGRRTAVFRKGHLLATGEAPFRLSSVIAAEGGNVTQLPTGQLVTGGGASAATSREVCERDVALSLQRLARLIPSAASIPVDVTWTCFRPAAVDGRAVVGRVEELSDVLVTQGHERTGLTIAPAVGRLLASMILKPGTAAPRCFLPPKLALP